MSFIIVSVHLFHFLFGVNLFLSPYSPLPYSSSLLKVFIILLHIIYSYVPVFILHPQAVNSVKISTILALLIAVSLENWIKSSIDRIQICLSKSLKSYNRPSFVLNIDFISHYFTLYHFHLQLRADQISFYHLFSLTLIVLIFASRVEFICF